MFLIIFAGLPATMVWAGTSFNTTLPAPMIGTLADGDASHDGGVGPDGGPFFDQRRDDHPIFFGLKAA